jgi:hypothetical protein
MGALVLGSASPAGAFGPAAVTVSPTPNFNGWITAPSATVTVRFDVDGFASSPSSGDYDELINAIACSGTGVTGGNYSGPPTIGSNGIVTTTFNVAGDSPSPGGLGVGCTATYQRTLYTNCGLFGCNQTLQNPAGTVQNGTNIRIDNSPPQNIVSHPAAAPAALNWHKAATVVNFTGEDPNSGVQSCSTNVPVSGPSTVGTRSAVGTCTNAAGLQRTGAYEYRFDNTPPTLAPTVSPGPVELGSAATATPHANDVHSGVASSSCDTPDTSTLGTHTVHCTATDVATNSAGADATYEVVPVPPTDPDGDGVFGDADKCPNTAGGGSLDGCPAAELPKTDPTPPTGDTGQTGTGQTGDTGPTGGGQSGLEQQQQQQQEGPSATTLTGSLGAITGNTITKSKMKNGYPLQVTCAADSNAAATLTVTSSVAKKLKLKVKKGQTTMTIGSATGQCKATGGGKLMLKLASSAKSKVMKSKRAIAATLGLEFTKPGSAPFKTSRSLKLK